MPGVINPAVSAALKGVRFRRGAVVVEMAIILPFLVLLLFGAIEFGTIFAAQEDLVTAAREGCRMAVGEAIEDDDIIAVVNQYMTAAGYDTYTIELTRSTPGNPQERVLITLPYPSVSIVPGRNYLGLEDFTLHGECVMRKES